jgi:glutathione S-transferase
LIGKARFPARAELCPDLQEEKTMKIYGVPFSVHTRKVIVAALEKKLPYRNEPVVPFDPPPGWADLSPTGKIPAFTDGDVTLCDSSVICAYLERTHPNPPIQPTETRDYVRALWFEEYADGTIFREVVHGLFFNQVIRPKILNTPGDQGAVDTILREAVPAVFGYLEKSLAGQYLAGDRFTIADIAVVSNLINFHYLGYALDRHPRLAGYFARMIRHASIAAALAAEQEIVAGMGLDHSFTQARAA